MSYYDRLSWAPASKPGQHGHLLSGSFSQVLRIKGTSIQLFQGCAGNYSFLDIFFFLFCCQYFLPTHQFHETIQNNIFCGEPTIATLQGLSFGAEEGTMPVFRESCLKPLDCRVPQYWETLAEVIRLPGQFNLKQLELWIWIPSIFLPVCGGEKSEGAFSKKLEEAAW